MSHPIVTWTLRDDRTLTCPSQGSAAVRQHASGMGPACAASKLSIEIVKECGYSLECGLTLSLYLYLELYAGLAYST